jgi:N-formylglutamate deformylase
MINNSFLNDEIKDSFLFHIPHSSINIPNKEFYICDDECLNNEILLSTDHNVDYIFDVDGIDKHIANFSRIFCDVERFNSENEIMNQYGRGIYYTKSTNNKLIREYNEQQYNYIIEKYYNVHHTIFNNIIVDKLNKFGVVYIVDVHSYNEHKLYFESNDGRPDICLGVDEKQTPQYLIDFFRNGFENNGFSVEINNPYSGTIYPNIESNKIFSIMVEINKRLYMENDIKINVEKMDELKKIVNNLFSF